MDYRNILNQLYLDFNARKIDAILAQVHTNVAWPNGWEGGYLHGHEQVRSYWLRQWQEINPKVLPISFQLRPAGEIAVDVQQIIKDLNGQVLFDGPVIHVYTLEKGKIRKMAIEQKSDSVP